MNAVRFTRMLVCVLFFVLFALIPSPAANAQSEVFAKWTARFDAARGNDAPVALAADSGGNVFVTGNACFNLGCTNQQAVTIKYDPSDKALWKAWLTSSAG